MINQLHMLTHEQAPVLLACGFFDGVHCGHQEVIRTAVTASKQNKGKAWVLTFDTHPMKVLKSDVAPEMLTSVKHKLNLIKSLGVAGCIVIPFTPLLAQMEPESFIKKLVFSIPTLHSLFIGKNWTFGRNRRGNLALLRTLGRKYKFHISMIPPVLWRGKLVSSTRIRLTIGTGKLHEAEKMLGRPVSMLGNVIRGRQIGRNIEIPTANLDCDNEVYPPNGVYAVEAIIAATKHPGIANIGTRPTIKERNKADRILELHLFNIRGNFYKRNIEVLFREKIRNERRFSSLQVLKRQIARDIIKAQLLLSSTSKKAARN